MILSKPSAKIISYPENAMSVIEKAGRICYKSQSKTNEKEETNKFIADKISRQHLSLLEHVSVTVQIICDRGVSHELVRHRQTHLDDDMVFDFEWNPAVSQESTRYCNYKGGVEFIIPPWVNIPEDDYDRKKVCSIANLLKYTDYTWLSSMFEAERSYLSLIQSGWTPQQARDVLPVSTKTEALFTANLREWRHFFLLRAQGITGPPHPQMIEITVPLLTEFKSIFPIIFHGIEAK